MQSRASAVYQMRLFDLSEGPVNRNAVWIMSQASSDKRPLNNCQFTSFIQVGVSEFKAASTS